MGLPCKGGKVHSKKLKWTSDSNSPSFQLLELGVLFVPIVGVEEVDFVGGVLFVPIVGVEEVDGLVVVAAGTGVEGG